MVCQPQHPEFRNNPENFQPCIIDLNITNVHTTCFVCVDALHPSQQFFNHVGTISCVPGL